MTEHKISSRTGKRTVTLLGFCPTTREKVVWEDEEQEIWICNEEAVWPWVKRWDRCFQLHPRQLFINPDNRNDPKHFEWLKAQRKPKIIYMQQHYKDIPASVKFPLHDMVEKYGRYSTSSFSYMMWMAMEEKFERIEIFGFDMASGTEYGHQRACSEYLIGLAKGLGFDIYIPPESKLLKDRLYGYDDSTVGFLQNVEMRRGIISQQEAADTELFAIERGRQDAMEVILKDHPELDWLPPLLEKQQEQTRIQMGKLNFVRGARTEVENMRKMYDKYRDTEYRDDTQ